MDRIETRKNSAAVYHLSGRAIAASTVLCVRLASAENLGGAGELAGGGAVEEPEQLAIGGAHQFSEILFAGPIAFEDGMQGGGFVGAADQKGDAGGRVQPWERIAEGVGVEFLNPVGDDQAGFLE